MYTEQTAFLLSSIVADRESRRETFGLENPLATSFWTVVKTGTSEDMRDNCCVGYSRRYTVGVWVGNFSGEPMQDVIGITGAAPVWLDGTDLGSARTLFPWNPTPGPHTLALVTADGHPFDIVTFEVRGIATAAAAD